MSFPVEIFFRNMDSSPLVANGLRRHAEGLGRYHPRITACRVTVEERAGRHRKGKLFNLRIAIAIPGHEIVVERAPDKRATHNHFRLAAHEPLMLRDASYRTPCAADGSRRPKKKPMLYSINFLGAFAAYWAIMLTGFGL